MKNVGVRSMIENRLSYRARHFPTKKSASRDGTLLVRRDSLALLPSSAFSPSRPSTRSAATFSSSIAFSSSFTSSRSSIVPLLLLPWLSLLLHPSSVLPAPTPPPYRLHAHMQRARPAGWHSVAFSAVHLRVS